MGFRLFPRFHLRHQLRRTFRAGPLRLQVGPDGVSRLGTRRGSLGVERQESTTTIGHSGARVTGRAGTRRPRP